MRLLCLHYPLFENIIIDREQNEDNESSLLQIISTIAKFKIKYFNHISGRYNIMPINDDYNKIRYNKLTQSKIKSNYLYNKRIEITVNCKYIIKSRITTTSKTSKISDKINGTILINVAIAIPNVKLPLTKPKFYSIRKDCIARSKATVKNSTETGKYEKPLASDITIKQFNILVDSIFLFYLLMDFYFLIKSPE